MYITALSQMLYNSHLYSDHCVEEGAGNSLPLRQHNAHAPPTWIFLLVESNMRNASSSHDRRDTQTDDTDGAVFFDVKQNFLANRTEANAITVIEELLSMDVKHVDWNSWPDLKSLIVSVLDTVTLPRLFIKYNVLLLKAINSAADKVVDLLAKFVSDRISEVDTLLAESHVAVVIAFSRRLHDENCTESVAMCIWRYVHLKPVLDELLEQLKDVNAEKRFRVHHVTSLRLKHDGDGSEIKQLVESLVSELDSRDILCQLNAIEILADISCS
ncbi:hypothetical protein AB6A40_008187 [Gnathostoma spinigerum]|uniref:26S proteasome non-ATPase regulatory subunit 5 n=1 Tax=Gnathostoma spinigerum TaxID=75299 RepID=A0ABD6EWN5_9BILA